MCCARNPRIKVLKRIVAELRGLAVPKLDLPDSSNVGSSDSLCISDVEEEDRYFFDVLEDLICPAVVVVLLSLSSQWKYMIRAFEQFHRLPVFFFFLACFSLRACVCV